MCTMYTLGKHVWRHLHQLASTVYTLCNILVKEMNQIRMYRTRGLGIKLSCIMLIFMAALNTRFELNVEPMFAVMALYDAKEKKKISESFHLDCNTSEIQQKWRDHREERSMASLARSAIFNITYPSSDVYLIIKVGQFSLSTRVLLKACIKYQARVLPKACIKYPARVLSKACFKYSGFSPKRALSTRLEFSLNILHTFIIH